MAPPGPFDSAQGRLPRASVPTRSKTKVKGGGQECPPYILCSLVTDRFHNFELELVMDSILSRKYDYRRRLPHFQNPALLCSRLSANLFASHFLKPRGMSFFGIVFTITVVDSICMLPSSCPIMSTYFGKHRPSLAGRIFRSCLTVRRKLRGQIRVHPPEPRAEGFSCPTRRLSVALDKEKVERGSAFGLEIFMTEVGDRGCDQGDGKTFARKDIVQRKH